MPFLSALALVERSHHSGDRQRPVTVVKDGPTARSQTAEDFKPPAGDSKGRHEHACEEYLERPYRFERRHSLGGRLYRA